MSAYTLAAGAFSSFDFLADPKLGRLKDYPTVTLTPQALPDARFADVRRDAGRETAFLGSLLGSFTGPRWMGGWIDVQAGHAEELDRRLKKSLLPSSAMKYGLSEDRLLLFEIPSPADAVAHLWPNYPPSHGHVFLHLTQQIFEVFDIYWRRKLGTSKGGDHLRRDVLDYAPQSRLTVLADPEAVVTVVANPKFLDEPALRRSVLEAGRKSRMTITAAPTLFG